MHACARVCTRHANSKHPAWTPDPGEEHLSARSSRSARYWSVSDCTGKSSILCRSISTSLSSGLIFPDRFAPRAPGALETQTRRTVREEISRFSARSHRGLAGTDPGQAPANPRQTRTRASPILLAVASEAAPGRGGLIVRTYTATDVPNPAPQPNTDAVNRTGHDASGRCV